jgi:succinate dehydrogenase hydrophobic anchor subunit
MSIPPAGRTSGSTDAGRTSGGAGDGPSGAPRILRREWTTAEGWRDTKAGMWAWLIQRAAAVLLVGAVALHLVNPFRRPVQAALLALVLVHGLLGVRSLMLDFGLPVRWHRALFVLAVLMAAVMFALVWWWWRWW